MGENGIMTAAGSGDVYVDLSTNSPTVIRRIHDECAARGVTVLDAPVSGGVYGAAAGTLAVMVGGDEDTYNTVKPMLDAIGAHVVYCGEIGNGMVTKICNNLLSMGIGVLMSEALTLGVKAGVSLETLADVIANSSGGNRRLVEKFPRYLFVDNFEPGFATALAAKDVRLATDLGREYGIPMELSNLVDQRHVEALFRGWGPEDSDAVAKLQEEKSGVHAPASATWVDNLATSQSSPVIPAKAGNPPLRSACSSSGVFDSAGPTAAIELLFGSYYNRL